MCWIALRENWTEMQAPTVENKAEFVSRCKTIAEIHGIRVQYHPARYAATLWNDLQIIWMPDELSLDVLVKLPIRDHCKDQWCLVVREFRSYQVWGRVIAVHRHLELMRQTLVLDDLSDV